MVWSLVVGRFIYMFLKVLLSYGIIYIFHCFLLVMRSLVVSGFLGFGFAILAILYSIYFNYCWSLLVGGGCVLGIF